jgi:hypothetical protein
MGLLRTVLAIASVLALTLGHATESAASKAALKCQQTIAKADAKFLAQRLKRLAVCSNAVLGCIQSQAPPVCVGKATAKCRKQLGAPGDVDAPAATLEAAVVKACGDVPVGELLGAEGLGFADAAAACAGVGVTPLATAANVARCVQRLHASLSETSFGVEAPRAAELTARGGVNAAVVPDLPVFGGCGDCGTPPVPTGKLVAGCAAAIDKAGATFLAKARGGLDKCATGLITCAQTKPGDAGCLAQAKATCQKLPDALATGRSKLQAALAKKCGGTLPFATLDAPAGANLGALICECDNVGVSPVATLDDYGLCLARQHECALASVLPSVAPTVGGLLADQGLEVSDLLCPPPDVQLSRFTPHGFFIFSNISKFMKSVFPGGPPKTTSSPLASRGLSPRVGRPTSLFGPCHPAPFRTCGFRFPITKRPLTLKAKRGTVAAPTMIIAVRRADGSFAQDHFEVPLGDTSVDNTVDVDITYADDLASCHFDLALTVVEEGEASAYTTVEQEPHPIPPNDECFTDRGIEGDTFTDVLDVTEATASDGESFPTSCGVDSIGNTVWYEFTAPANGILTADTFGTDYDTVLAVWTGACNDLAEQLCNNDAGGTPQSKVAIPVQQGVTYFIEAGANTTSTTLDTGTLHFAFHFTPAGTPPTIAKLTADLVEINSPTICAFNNATAYRLGFDFTDPDGDVLPSTAQALVHAAFEPSGNVSDFSVFPVDVTGDGFSGHVSFLVCNFFSSDSAVDTSVRLADLAGAGNTASLKIKRPPGAN